MAMIEVKRSSEKFCEDSQGTGVEGGFAFLYSILKADL